jgi:hypothetical protein
MIKRKKNGWACIANIVEEFVPFTKPCFIIHLDGMLYSVYLPSTLSVASPVQLYVSN